jgi:hypothetical protein
LTSAAIDLGDLGLDSLVVEHAGELLEDAVGETRVSFRTIHIAMASTSSTR